jgi:hypothetical protein
MSAVNSLTVRMVRKDVRARRRTIMDLGLGLAVRRRIRLVLEG